MSDNFMVLFPAEPLRPKPDWPRLRAQLLECGFLREPTLRRPDHVVVHHLWDRILEDRGRPERRAPDRLGSGLETLIEGLKGIEFVPGSFALDCDGLTVSDFIAAMQKNGFLSPEFTFPEQEEFWPGPLYWKLSSMDEPSNPRHWGIEIAFQDFGASISVACGGDLFEPPGIPGTDRVCADWAELMGRWCRDPTQHWIDPETGKGYGLLDLDWDDTLGAGRCWLWIHTPAYLDGNQAAALLAKLTGQPFRHSHYHI